MRRMLWAAALTVAVGGAGPILPVVGDAPAQAASAEEKKVRFSSVSVKGKEVLRLAATKELLADERAEKVQERLVMMLEPDRGEALQPVKASDVVVTNVDNNLVIRLRNQNIVQITPEDAKLNGMAPEALAQQWAEGLRTSLAQVKVAEGAKLPEGTITIAKGQMTTQGGGAGGAPKDKQDKPDKKDKKDK